MNKEFAQGLKILAQHVWPELEVDEVRVYETSSESVTFPVLRDPPPSWEDQWRAGCLRVGGIQVATGLTFEERMEILNKGALFGQLIIGLTHTAYGWHMGYNHENRILIVRRCGEGV